MRRESQAASQVPASAVSGLVCRVCSVRARRWAAEGERLCERFAYVRNLHLEVDAVPENLALDILTEPMFAQALFVALNRFGFDIL